MTYPSFLIEELYWENNQLVVGLDEAGRGCLAGPVFAAAVVFPKDFDIESNIQTYFSRLVKKLTNDLKLSNYSQNVLKMYCRILEHPKILINDSKLLNPFFREIAYDFIVQVAHSFSISQVDPNIIDEINILQATQLAFKKSLEKLKLKNEHIIIDGNYFKKFKDLSFETVVKGDSKSLSIAAASILAKVSRDSYLKSIMHNKYPEFGFNHHFGYATKEHFEAINEFGITEFHRLTFLKKYYERKSEIFQQALF